jgi:hypothetical protein
MVAMFVNGSGQNEQSLERTFHRCFLPSFSSFGWEVSEEKIKMWKVNGQQTTDAKWWQKLALPLARWANKKVCTEIPEKTSSLGVAIRTQNEIKEKWNYLKKRGKKHIHEPQTRARENSVSFKGLDGVDTCMYSNTAR